MSKWTIYSKSGVAKYEASNLEYHDVWMGEEYVTVNISSPTPIDIEIGDYLIYRGLTYTIYSLPTALKQARSGSYGDAFKYDGVKFSARSTELTEIRFFDIVLYDNGLHYTSLPTFSFYAATIDDLLDRIQANIDRDNEKQWIIVSYNYNRTVGRYEQGSAARAAAQALWEETFGTDHDHPIHTALDNVKRNVNISIDKQNIFDSLQHIKNSFGLNFITRERTIVVGTEGVSAEHLFQYGKGNGLSQIEKNAEADQQVVTKLFAYGSDKNIPTRYYAEYGKKYFVNADSAISPVVNPLVVAISFRCDVHGEEYYPVKSSTEITEPETAVDLRRIVTLECDGYTCKGYYREYHNGQGTTGRNYEIHVASTAIGTQEDIYEPSLSKAKVFAEAIRGKTSCNIIEGIDKKKWPSDHISYDSAMPSKMAVNVLMLPGFPELSLAELCTAEYDSNTDKTTIRIRKNLNSPYNTLMVVEGDHRIGFSDDRLMPFITSPNISKLGVKEGDIHFTEDNDDNGLEEVCPTVEGMTEDDVFNNGSNARLDEIVACETITDDGEYNTENPEEKFTDFHITIPNLGFNLYEAARDSGGDMTISLTDGYCGGRDFKVDVKTENIKQNADLTWDLKVQRSPDDTLSLMFPYSDAASRRQTPVPDEPYQIRTGDHYVLTGIDITDTSYIWGASVKALRKAIEWLLNNDYTRFTYLPKVDEIYMARQNDDAIASQGAIDSLHDTLKAGMLMRFKDDDLAFDGIIFIDTLTINEEGNNGIPTYDVVLRNDKQVSTIQRVQNQISSLSSYVNNGGGGMSASQIRSLIKTYGGEQFLSKLNDDTAQGFINLLKGLQVGGIFNTGPLGVGGVFRKESDGTTYVEADKLYVRMKAYFDSVEIREYKYTGGNRVASVAGNKAIRIEWIKKINGEETVLEQIPANRSNVDFFRCYFRASDGEDTVMNNFVVGDMVYCHVTSVAGSSDNPEQGGLNQKHYWRLCVGRNEEGIYTEDGEAWIDISNKTVETISSVSYPGYQSGSDIPAAQDSMIQLGNVNDTTRQGTIIEFVTGANAPTYQIFQGIGSDATNPYSLEDKNQIAFGYNSQTGHAYMDVFGDLFVGDRSKQHGYLMFDQQDRILELSGRLSVGSTLADGRDVNALGTAKANLLLNSSFTGDYDSEDVSADSDVTEDTIIYSDPLKHWSASNVEIITSEESESGYAAKIANDGTLAQDVSLQQGKWYVLSFRGNGGTLDYSVGGSTGTITLKQTIDFYSVPFVCETNSGLSFTATSQVVLMEIQLSEGNVPTAWTQNYTDSNKTMASVNEYKYVSDAIRNGNTDILGGLILSQLIKVGNYRNKTMMQETGGMSGIFTSGNSPFLWGGGTMSQAIYTIMKYANNPSYQASDEEVANMAQFVVTHGGRAILNDIILRGYVYALGGTFRGHINAESGNITGAVKIGEDGGRRVLVLDPHSISGQPNSPALYGKIQNETRFALSLLRELGDSFSEHANIKMNGYDGNDVITESEFSDDRFHLKYEVNDPEPSLMGKDFTFDIAYDNGIVFTIKRKNFDTAKEDTITIKLPYDGRIEMRFVDGEGGCLIPPSPSGLLVGSIYHDNGILKVVLPSE